MYTYVKEMVQRTIRLNVLIVRNGVKVDLDFSLIYNK